MTVQRAETHRFLRPQTAQQAVLAELRGLLIRGELLPGAAIAQESLAEMFGVSRVPVREALKILEGEGLVVYAAHRGYSVAKLEVADLLEIFDLREVLESHVIRVAVPRLEDADQAGMRAAIVAMDRAADAADMVAVGVQNRAFHFTLFEASGLARAVEMIRRLWDTTDPYRSLYFQKPLTRQSANAEHELILEACAARDVERVVALHELHRSHTVEDLRAMNGVWP
ncbi:GntR family transcriptional regulator [Intrasporangium sp.]|uniref:GntR family transcriptional regulator n=1 Tax=Intrasporangium sp. TaxID=1925024 RepID=UPI003221E12C